MDRMLIKGLEILNYYTITIRSSAAEWVSKTKEDNIVGHLLFPLAMFLAMARQEGGVTMCITKIYIGNKVQDWLCVLVLSVYSLPKDCCGARVGLN